MTRKLTHQQVAATLRRAGFCGETETSTRYLRSAVSDAALRLATADEIRRSDAALAEFPRTGIIWVEIEGDEYECYVD